MLASLNSSILSLGPIALGSATFGREIDDAASFALMDHAVARGIKHFDTAAAYSAGASERIVGAWRASRRPAAGTLSIATKVTTPYDPAAITGSVEKSLASLGGSADLLYVHKWDRAVLDPAVLETLASFVRSGRVGALAASNFTHDQLRRAIEQQSQLGLPRFRALQNNHNLAVREIDPPLRQLCADQGIAIVTFSPLGAGFLTGKHRDGVPKGSRFDLIPGHQRIYFQEQPQRRLGRLEAVAKRTGLSQTQLALSWALHQPGSTVLVGGRTTAHIDQAFDAKAWYDPAILAELDQA